LNLQTFATSFALIVFDVGQKGMCSMLSNVLVGLLTGLITSVVVSGFFYRLGRGDARKMQWVSQIDSILLRLAYLDPKRRESIRPGDGVDDTSHALLCSSALMASSGFRTGADTVRSIAATMAEWCATKEPKSYDDGERMKRQWEAQLTTLRAPLLK
jgi:hypothetical protein